MADDLQRKHQDGQGGASDPMHAFHRRACEMRNVLESGFPEAVRLVVDENADCTPKWNYVVSGRRFKTRDQTPEIGYQDEEAQSHQKRRKPLAVMADHLSALAFDEPVQAFQHVLQSARALDRKPGSQ